MQELYGTLSGIFTAASMLALIAIALWAWSDRRRASFDASARAPLEEDQNLSAGSREQGK